jgi:hypothetical protein
MGLIPWVVHRIVVVMVVVIVEAAMMAVKFQTR